MNKWLMLSIASLTVSNTNLFANEKLKIRNDSKKTTTVDSKLLNIQVEATDAGTDRKLKDRM